MKTKTLTNDVNKVIDQVERGELGVDEANALLEQPVPDMETEMKEGLNLAAIPLFSLQPTDNPELFRVVDREGNWTHYWHSGLKKYLPSVNHILHIGFPKGDGFMNYLLGTTKDEAKKTLESAGERGSRIHDAIRQLIDGVEIDIDRKFKNDLTGRYEPLTNEEWDMLLAWVAWVKEFEPSVMVHESAGFNEKYGYAGTEDFYGRIVLKAGTKVYINDKATTITKTIKPTVLLDWKSSSGIWDEYRAQVSSYANFGKHKKQPDYTGVVRLGTRHKNGGYEIRLWDKATTKKHFQIFLSARDIFLMNYEPFEPSQDTIPAMIAVTIPKVEEKITKPKKENK